MKFPSYSERFIDRVILLFLFALFLFASPLVEWWAGGGAPWFAPYLLWLLLILVMYLLQRGAPDDPHEL
ncbi:MAG: hypothetical protein A2286_05155 [Gammaproteobacteria bacterium RIFOXYA12_FULL_61_12]|nr:MAG: hypothetical protein A2286_05155 [Gammaproteobacteria bacterium RIFOXYA12_FULL_61_12]OGT90795.1 MAG: hypothetical protein A2514_04250 [Gammaproteobacteria bacterium RIFOXYD12_FULL_61_37]